MTIQRKRRRARLFIGTGVLMAVVVGGTTLFMLQQAPRPAAQEEVAMTDVVVATRDIPARTPIGDTDVAVRSMPLDDSNAFAVTDPSDVVGRSSAVAIVPGQIITANLLVSTDPAQGGNLIPAPGATFDPNGPPMRAVSVSVPDAQAVGGNIQPGQRVDVIATVQILAPEEAETDADAEEAAASDLDAGPSTKVTLQNVTVLSRAAEIYILQVDLEAAEQIAQIMAAAGTFTLVLRPDADVQTAETDGSTTDELVDEYGFPIPRKIRPGGATPADVE